MNRAQLVMLSLLAATLVGCGSSDSTEQPIEKMVPQADTATAKLNTADQARVTKVITIAKEIRANAAQAQSILENHGMTLQQFEDELYAISADADLSAVYNAALDADG